MKSQIIKILNESSFDIKPNECDGHISEIVDKIMTEIKKERLRIWDTLNAILPIDDYGDLEQGDEVHKIIFNTKIPICLKRDISFEKAVNPAIRYLLQNHHPHTKIYIDYDRAEIIEGVACHNLTNEVPD